MDRTPRPDRTKVIGQLVDYTQGYTLDNKPLAHDLQEQVPVTFACSRSKSEVTLVHTLKRSSIGAFSEADVAHEPPHVHVTKEGNEAKFWLDPVRVAREGRFRKSDLRDIQRIVEDNLQFLLNAWNQEKSKHVNG